MKGLSDGNVLLQTGHGAGAGMSSALQPGKWLCPVLVAPASNTHMQTHLCVCVCTCIPLTRPVFSAQESPLTKPHVFCLPGKDWNRNGCPTFARSHHNKTHSTKSRGAEWLSLAESLYRTALQASFLSPALCPSHFQVDSEVHTKIFTRTKVPRHTSDNSD